MTIRDLGLDAGLDQQKAYAHGFKAAVTRQLKICPPWHMAAQSFWYDGYEDGYDTCKEAGRAKLAGDEAGYQRAVADARNGTKGAE